MNLGLYREISKTGWLSADTAALGAFKIDGLQEGTGKLTPSNKLQCNLNSIVIFCRVGQCKNKEC